MKVHDENCLIFNSLKKYPALNRQDEINVSKKIKEESSLKNRKKAKELLFLHNMKLLVSIYKVYKNYDHSVDLLQEGAIGLWEACEKFDYTKGFKFSTYATYLIRRRMLLAINQSHKAVRLPVYMSNLIRRLYNFKNKFYSLNGEDPQLGDYEKEFQDPKTQIIRALQFLSYDFVSLDPSLNNIPFSENPDVELDCEILLNCLTEKERFLFEGYFGLNGNITSLKEISSVLNISVSRGGQILNNGLKKLRKNRKNNQLRDYIA